MSSYTAVGQKEHTQFDCFPGDNNRLQGTDLGLEAWLPKGARVDASFWQRPTAALPASPVLHYYGQDEEDRYAHETFFSGLQSGTYLELGAFDGIHLSNTLFFAERGWRGVLIEPSTQLFQSLAVNRPDDIRLHAAICADNTQVHFVEGRETGGIYEFMAPKFVAQWHPNVKVDELPTVLCMPLSTVLASSGLHHINFFSLDVENAELEVLKTVDFSLVRFDVIVVEADASSPVKDKAVKQLLADNQYHYHGHIIRNDWFVHTSLIPDAPH